MVLYICCGEGKGFLGEHGGGKLNLSGLCCPQVLCPFDPTFGIKGEEANTAL